MSKFLELCRPGQCINRIWEIDLAGLKASGIDCLLLDLDNTLLPWQSSDVPEECVGWLEEAGRLGMKICIVSNTHSPRRLRKIAEKLGVPAIDRALKPRPHGFDQALEMLGTRRERAVVVGDQILTDILGGNMAGMRTIHVEPMHPREFIGTKFSRLVEKVIFAFIRRNARAGTNADSIQSEMQEDE